MLVAAITDHSYTSSDAVVLADGTLDFALKAGW
jgi:hypothetical protein